MSAPVLVFAWGNRSRGDDALGPLFAERLRTQAAASPAQVAFLEDYQLQIEHALDLDGRERVLFVDASAAGTAPFEAGTVQARRDASFSSHAVSPQALLQVYREVHRAEPPPCWLLAIRGERFGLGDPLSPAAARHLDLALAWGRDWIARGAA